MSAKCLARFLPAIVLAGALLLGLGVPAAGARSVCQARIDRAQAKLSNDVYRHGELSSQAARARARLTRVQERCSPEVE